MPYRAGAALVAVILVTGCSAGTPTAPTPPMQTAPPVVVSPPSPPVVTPPPTPPPVVLPAFPPTDPRFNLSFYRQLVHDALESPGRLQPLRRQREAPRIYLRTVDDGGAPIDAVTLDLTAAAVINVAGSLTGVFGLAGLERGTDTRQGQPGWITVRWSHTPDPTACGRASVGGDLLMLYPRTPGCRCSGHPAIMEMATVKHELGHALGFWHTDGVDDLMYGRSFGECDKNPTEREKYHAAIAYQRPIGSAPP